MLQVSADWAYKNQLPISVTKDPMWEMWTHEHNSNPSCKGKVEEKKSEERKSPKSTRRVPSTSPKPERKSQRGYSKSGNRNVKINRGLVSTVESEEKDKDENDYT